MSYVERRMRIEEGSSTKPFSSLVVKHNGEEIYFDTRQLNKPSVITTEKVFEYINSYMSRLHPTRQQAIFNCYAKVREAMDKIYVSFRRHSVVANAIKELYEQIQYKEIVFWAINYGDIQVPSSIMTNYESLEIAQRSSDSYEKRTYLRKDYVELQHLAIMLKAMVPIWGEYLTKLTDERFDTNRKDTHAMSLIDGSEIMKVPAMERLREFVYLTTPPDKEMGSAILQSMTTSDIPDWLLASVMIRKLPLVEISSHDETSNLASVVFNGVKNTAKGIDRRFAGRIRGKNKPNDSSSQEGGNKGVFDIYKTKERTSAGDLTPLSIWTEHIDNILRKVEPNITQLLTKTATSNINRLVSSSYQPTVSQDTIIRYTLSSCISPLSIDDVSYKSLTVMAASAQVILRHWGFHDLAMLITAKEQRDENDMLVGGIESRSRIPKELTDELNITHPYAQLKGGRDKNSLSNNIAYNAVELLSKEFMKCDWIPVCDTGLLKEVELDPLGVYIVTPDIKTQIAELLIKLNK